MVVCATNAEGSNNEAVREAEPPPQREGCIKQYSNRALYERGAMPTAEERAAVLRSFYWYTKGFLATPLLESLIGWPACDPYPPASTTPLRLIRYHAR